MKNSETIGKIAEALTKIQSEIRDVYKDRKGYNYNYADLASVLEIIRPLASNNGIAFVQMPIYRGAVRPATSDVVGVETILIHTSGEYLSGKVYAPIEKIMKMSVAQSVGNVITYLRRYALSSFFGIAQTDNDAQSVEASKEENHSEHQEMALKKRNVETLKELLKKCNVSEQEFQTWLSNSESVSKIEELTNEKVESFIARFNKKLASIQMEKEKINE